MLSIGGNSCVDDPFMAWDCSLDGEWMESGEVVIVESWHDRNALRSIGPLSSCSNRSHVGIVSYTYHKFKHGA